jgi:pyridoxamine 5'-phosphate oxidase family protein
MFTEKELEYLNNQPLARIATVGANGAPHVVPVGFKVSDDGDALVVGGHDLSASKKWRDLQVNPKVAIVIDDLETIDPWLPRGIAVRGIAELHDDGGTGKVSPAIQGEAWLQVIPKRVTSWGIEGRPFTPAGRRNSRNF